MRPRCIPLLFLLCACASAQKTSPPAHLSKETRLDLIHVFNAEIVYIRAQFPMGKKGLAIKDGVVSPSGEELQKLLALWGPAIKPGDEARITNVVVKSNSIHFEINGGPVKKQKWYQHVSVGVGGGSVPVSPSDQNANPRGTYVDLLFDHYVPELTPQQVKDLVRPVFDFDAKSAVEAYLDTVPPKVKEAIQNHKVLVGMNREMVTYSKGRAPRKIREKDGDTEYEDWIYGEPPQDVEFVRMVGDEVVRVETMKVDGTKTLRTEKEVTLETQPSVAKADQAKPAHAPSLRRPGEAEPDRPAPSGTQTPVLTPPAGSDPPPTGPPNYSI